MAFQLTSDNSAKLDALLGRYPTKRAALLPVLWICQRQNGWVSPDVIDFVAEKLELSTATVKGVVTFYTMFFDHPVGENVIWVCRTLSCELRGARAIERKLMTKLGCDVGHNSNDGKFTLLRTECLAACGGAPMIQIGDRYYENLTEDKIDVIIDTIIRAGIEEAERKYANAAVFREPTISSVPPAPAAEARRIASDPPGLKPDPNPQA